MTDYLHGSKKNFERDTYPDEEEVNEMKQRSIKKQYALEYSRKPSKLKRHPLNYELYDENGKKAGTFYSVIGELKIKNYNPTGAYYYMKGGKKVWV